MSHLPPNSNMWDNWDLRTLALNSGVPSAGRSYPQNGLVWDWRFRLVRTDWLIDYFFIIILQLYFSRGSVLGEVKHCWHYRGSYFFALSWLAQNLHQEQKCMEWGLITTLTMRTSLQTARIWEKSIVNDLSMFKFGVSKAWHPQDLS